MTYRAEIDGLRAIAVFPVIFFHAGFDFFSGGYVGVDVFFVISGYLITNIIIEGLQNNNFSLIHFYERRARRILPALLVVVCACMPFAWYFFTPHEMIYFSKNLIYVTTYISNFLFLNSSNYFDLSSEMSALLHTWSLSVEEQYYFLFPFFMIYLWKKHINKINIIFICLIIASFISAIVLIHFKPTFSFYMLLTRAWELLIGASIARFLTCHALFLERFSQLKRGIIALFGIILILASVIYFDYSTPVPSHYTLLPVIGASLIILFADKNNICGFLLSRKIIVYFGLISYGMYLWHQPLFVFLRIISGGVAVKENAIGLIFFIIIISHLTRKYIEIPFRNFDFIKLNKFIFCMSMLSLFIIVFGSIGIKTGGYSSRFPNISPMMTQNSYALQQVDRCFLLNKSSVVFDLEPCTDSHSDKKKILLIGDSHAASLYPGLKEYLKLHNVDVVMMTSAFCLPLVENFHSIKNKSANKRCEDINSQVVKNIESNHYDLIVVSAYMLQWGFTEDWSWSYQNYYSDFMKKIKLISEKNKILVVGQFVVWPNGLDQVIYKEAIELDIKNYLNFSQYSASGLHPKMFQMETKYKNDMQGLGLNYASIIDQFCDGKQCLRYVTRNHAIKLVTFDYGHLGLEASQYVSEYIVGPRIVDLIQ